ncbi:sec-independent protein translocase protein TATA protein [Artemisia annua]|uniref:Sec-independent protein translocase protein TATA protein n=1 Tax=Artemisia annua TaxID=35608 RepID=A0A2U1M1T2_ARTAN|nr:sec-independent protein translocase protein TATA protein [Artemisia annua]
MAMSTAAAATLSLPSISIPTTKKAFSFSSSNSSFFNTSSFKPLTIKTQKSSQLKKNSKGFSCNCLFGLGVPELAVIAGVAVLVFGPKKLPEVGRSIGKTVKSFQQAAKEFETELKKEPDTIAESPDATAVNEKEPEDLKVPTTKDSL